jgi:hypothetical protein
MNNATTIAAVAIFLATYAVASAISPTHSARG